MYEYFLSGLLLSGISLFVMIDGHHILYDKLVYKYNKWKKLNKLVKTQHSNSCMIVLVSLKMILKALYISLIQYLNQTIIKLDKNMYEKTYVVNGKMYKMIIMPSRGPSPVLQISNEKNEDVTEDILAYLGPEHNWHYTYFTPKFFNYESLTFQLSDGTELTFHDRDTIVLN